MALPARTHDTMSDAISLSSPNGHMSNRARTAAQEALRISLFGKDGLQPVAPKQPSRADKLRWRIRDLRSWAEHGMSKRAFTKEANLLQAELDTIVEGDQG